MIIVRVLSSGGGATSSPRASSGGWLLPAGCGKASRPNVGAYLVEMSLMHGDGLWRVLADSGGCEARPGWKVSVVDGLTPCGKGRRKQAGVVKGNAIGDVVVR
jgi:hypothetical protein